MPLRFPLTPLARWTLALACALIACEPPQPAVRPSSDLAPTAPPSPAPAAPSAHPRTGWNAAEIHWEPFASGMARARAEHRPACLVLHADWCPHCRNYSHVFDDPRIVARSRDFVMMLVNVDEAPDVAGRYALDGPYVPRTYFLSPDGQPMADVDAHRSQYRYFFNESDPSSLLGAMNIAATRAHAFDQPRGFSNVRLAELMQ